MHNGARHAHLRYRQQIFSGDPLAVPAAKWNPISEPLRRCAWESRFSKLLSKINGRLSASHIESLANAGTSSNIFLLLFFLCLTTIINSIPFAASRLPQWKTLSPLDPYCLVTRLCWGMARGERNLARGRLRGVEKTAKAVKERAKGLYRKSIPLFQFFRRLAAKGDKAKASLPQEQYQLSSLHKSILSAFSCK